MAKLSEDELDAALEDLPEWTREGDEIERELQLPTFPAAIDLVVQIADIAQAADHHPDIDIRYNRLRIVLTTHDAGGLTNKDIELATSIEAAAHDAGAS